MFLEAQLNSVSELKRKCKFDDMNGINKHDLMCD